MFASLAFAVDPNVWLDALKSYGQTAYCQPEPAGSQQNLNSSWIVLSGLGLAASVFLVSLAFIASYGLQNPKGIAWAKENLFQVFVSAIVVIFFLLSTGVVDSLSSVYSQGSKSSIEMAIAYAHAIGGTVSADLMVVTLFNVAVSVMGTMHVLLNPGGLGGIVFQTSYMFRPIMDLLNMIIVMLSAVFGEWFVHLFLLCFIKKYMLSIFLPAGIFLRTFSLTRGMGGALITIAIGFYIVYPAMMNVSAMAIAEKYELVDANGNDCTMGWGVQCFFKTHLGGDYVKNLLGMIGATPFFLITLIFGSNFGLVVGIPYLIFSAAISMLMDVAYFLVIVGMILPLLNLFVTFSAIREISKHLGTDVNIGSLMRIL